MDNSPTALTGAAYYNLYAGFKGAAQALKDQFKTFKTEQEFVRSKAATIFVLSWMRDHFLFQKRFDALFQRSVMQGAADQFTAALALSLEMYLTANGTTSAVRSEVAMERRRGALRPDISVWDNHEAAVAVIECKTNFGYNRNGWAAQYYERTTRIHALFPDCLSTLCVLTKQNWERSWEQFKTSDLAGREWFCLTEVWPSDIGDDCERDMIHPIESLFVQIRYTLNAAR